MAQRTEDGLHPPPDPRFRIAYALASGDLAAISRPPKRFPETEAVEDWEDSATLIFMMAADLTDDELRPVLDRMASVEGDAAKLREAFRYLAGYR